MSNRVYIPARDAESVSEALFALSRPSAIRSNTEVSNARCSCLLDATGNKWLGIDTDEEILIHPQGDFNPIAAHLQPLEDDGRIAAGSVSSLQSCIDSNRGKQMRMWDAFPTFFKSQAKTYQQMIDAGLLQSPSVP